MWPVFDYFRNEKKNKHNAELQQTDPGTKKLRANSVPRVVFAHLMLQIDFYSTGPMKIHKNVKNYPPWTMVVPYLHCFS